ncbi:MAG: DUF2752 domain-containing protein [Gemmataceae bacterium]|nr:DUF2752 domain-containing protein [Gemmataceae bacterium]
MRAAVRGAILALVAAALGVALVWVADHPPTRDSRYPKCFHYKLSGTHCPGCGTARALHFALNGDLARAAGNNVFSLVALPVVLVATVPKLVRWVLGRPQSDWRLGARWVKLLVVLLLLFWISRNIPLYPFTLLAPTELP